MDVDAGQLPIPDWGLICPRCRYPLRGLPAHRCPECGVEFDVAELLRPWTRVRPPKFAGDERPLPDFGLTCPACKQNLAGASEDACPNCGVGFDVAGLRPHRPWFVVDAELTGGLPIPGIQAALSNENVPHVPVGEQTVAEIWGGQSITVSRLRVPSEFFFEVLWLIRRTHQEVAVARRTAHAEWRCSQCDEANPAHFEVCWNCERPRDDR